MATVAGLGWAIRRLSRMSTRETLHRFFEAGRRGAHRRLRGWSEFGDFGGAINPVWSHVDLAALNPSAAKTADVLAGWLRFLNQDWPPPNRDDWWVGDIWRLDPVSGLLWPGADTSAFNVSYRHDAGRGDVKFVWELNRLQFLPALAASGAEGLDTAFDIMAGWMAANPPYRGINWTSGIEAASRLASVLAVVSRATRPLSETEDRCVRAFVEAHAYWIDRFPSLYSSANNHRVAELAALHLTGLAAPGMPSAGRYRRSGRAGLEREILRQFYADGVGAEQSPTYAAYSLEWFVLADMASAWAGEPMSEAYKTRAGAAAAHLRWIIDDAGHAPHIGDGDEGRVLLFGFAGGAGYPLAVAKMTERWLGSGGGPAQAAPIGLRTFSEGGYTVARTLTPRGTALFVFDHAPLGFLSIAAHGHADALAVWLHWGDEPILVDAGTGLYHSGGVVRDTFRGTPAHNTLALKGEDQSKIVGPFAWSHHAKARIVASSTGKVVAEQAGYLRRFGLIHQRSVQFGETDYVIEDRLIGDTRGRPRDWRAGYLLNPNVRVDVAGPAATLNSPGGRSVIMTIEHGPHWRVEPARYSPRFNQYADTLRLVVEAGFTPRADPVISRIKISLGR